MEYASKAVGTAGLTTGIIGTALGALGGGLSMLNGGLNNGYANNGMYRNSGCPSISSDDHFVTRYEMDMQQQLAHKDSEIALLKSEQNTEIKIADVYERLITRINADKNEQQKINTEQAVWNGVNTATMGCMRNQIDQLYSLTALRIPNTSVCPGWGEVTVTPTPATAG